jgi:hypothetical protein
LAFWALDNCKALKLFTPVNNNTPQQVSMLFMNTHVQSNFQYVGKNKHLGSCGLSLRLGF